MPLTRDEILLNKFETANICLKVLGEIFNEAVKKGDYVQMEYCCTQIKAQLDLICEIRKEFSKLVPELDYMN